MLQQQFIIQYSTYPFNLPIEQIHWPYIAIACNCCELIGGLGLESWTAERLGQATVQFMAVKQQATHSDTFSHGTAASLATCDGTGGKAGKWEGGGCSSNRTLGLWYTMPYVGQLMDGFGGIGLMNDPTRKTLSGNGPNMWDTNIGVFFPHKSPSSSSPPTWNLVSRLSRLGQKTVSNVPNQQFCDEKTRQQTSKPSDYHRNALWGHRWWHLCSLAPLGRWNWHDSECDLLRFTCKTSHHWTQYRNWNCRLSEKTFAGMWQYMLVVYGNHLKVYLWFKHPDVGYWNYPPSACWSFMLFRARLPRSADWIFKALVTILWAVDFI